MNNIFYVMELYDLVNYADDNTSFVHFNNTFKFISRWCLLNSFWI